MTTAVATSKSTAGYSGDDTTGVAFAWPGAAPELPTTATEELAGASDLGTVTDAGVVHAIARETTDVKSISGRTFHVLQTSVDHTFTVTLADAVDLTVLRLIVGDDNVVVDGSGNVTVRHNQRVQPRRTFVFDFLLDQGIKRSVIEVGQVISVGDVTHVSTSLYEFQVTIKVFSGPRIEGDFIRDLYAFQGAASLAVATGMLPTATVGAEYSFTVRSTGGEAPYTYAAESGLPEGLSMSDAGVISGTPTTEGEHSVVIKVSDASGAVTRKTLTLHVA